MRLHHGCAPAYRSAVALLLVAALKPPLFAADFSGEGIILPIVDRIGNPEIAMLVDDAFRGVVQIGVQVKDNSALRDALRERRIRQVHTASPEELARLGQSLGFDWLLTLTLHEAFANPVPQITLSAALYRVGDPVYDWIDLISGTGLDRVTWLGIGEIYDLPVLASQTALELGRRAREGSPPPGAKPRFGPVKHGFLRDSASLPSVGQRIALAPLNSISRWLPMRSAEIATLSIMAALHARGFEITYPGLVRRIMLQEGRLFLGETTESLRLTLREGTGADWVLTGTVEVYQQGGGISPNPRVAIGCRLVDSRTGRIVWMDGVDRSGRDSDTVFHQGTVFSAGVLTLEIARSMVAAFSPSTRGGLQG